MTTKDELLKNLLLIRINEKLNQLESIDKRHKDDLDASNEIHHTIDSTILNNNSSSSILRDNPN